LKAGDFSLADNPQENNRRQEPNFDLVTGDKRTGPRPTLGDPLDLLRQKPEVKPQPAQDRPAVQPQDRPIVRPADQPLPPVSERLALNITGKTLELSYNDKDFEKKLSYAGKYHSRDFNNLKITDMPPGVKITPWVDSKGYFFYFNDGTAKPKEFHYFPPNLQFLTTPKDSTDLTKLRNDVMIAYNKDISQTVTAETQGAGGFLDFNRQTDPNRDGAASAFQYYQRMSGLSDRSLNTLETTLREGVRTSDNPYLKIWLADVYMAQAMKGIVGQALTGQPVDLKDPVLMRKLDDAISLNRAARMSSDNTLGDNGMKRQGNGYLPMRPYDPYWDRRANGFYGFWGGSGDQAAYREAALTTLKGLIQSNAIPRLELPPALPPKRF